MAKIHQFPKKEEIPRENLLFLFEQAMARVPFKPYDPIRALCASLARLIIVSGDNPHNLPDYAQALVED